MKTVITLIGAGLAACMLPSCNNMSLGGGVAAYQSYDRPAKLPSNPSAVRVKVSLSKQMIYVMEGSTPLLVTPCNVGTRNAPTPSGSFRIFSKNQYKRANSHGWGLQRQQRQKK